MTAPMNVYGFRYRHAGRNYALDVLAASEQDAKAKVAEIAKAEFVSELHPTPERDDGVPDAAVVLREG